MFFPDHRCLGGLRSFVQGLTISLAGFLAVPASAQISFGVSNNGTNTYVIDTRGLGAFIVRLATIPPASGVSTCTVQVDGSSDNTTFGSADVLASQSCLSRAAFISSIAGANWIRLNIAQTGTANVQFQLNVDRASSSNVTGAVASGSAASSNPVLVGGTDGTNTRTFLTDTGGRITAAVNTEGTKSTYRAATNFSPTATAATDIFTITNSGSKIIRVTHLGIACTATAAIASDIIFLKRSAGDGAGTAVTAVPLDSNDSAATASVQSYTANPTLGTLIGSISDDKASITTSTGAPQFYFEDFTIRNSKGVVLRPGVTQVLAVNLNGASIAGIACAAEVEWTEE